MNVTGQMRTHRTCYMCAPILFYLYPFRIACFLNCGQKVFLNASRSIIRRFVVILVLGSCFLDEYGNFLLQREDCCLGSDNTKNCLYLDIFTMPKRIIEFYLTYTSENKNLTVTGVI